MASGSALTAQDEQHGNNFEFTATMVSRDCPLRDADQASPLAPKERTVATASHPDVATARGDSIGDPSHDYPRTLDRLSPAVSGGG